MHKQAIAESMAEPISTAGTTVLPISDTVRMPWTPVEELEERVVPPSLAILFRLAVGPMADYYAPRFLRYEQTGKTFPSWHWPSLWWPGVWAFYRKLWWPGFAFATLPFLGAAAFAAIEPVIGGPSFVWWTCAVLVVWILPGLIPAVFANTLLFVRIRRLVQRAAEDSNRTDEAARLLAARKPTAISAAVFIGGGAIALALVLGVPRVRTLYQDHIVRDRVAESLLAVAPLQRQVEDSWQRSGLLPRKPDYRAVIENQGASWLENVNLSPVNGRVRLDLGPAFTEISGKAILLAPAIDPRQHVHWMCIPIDVPAKFLPRECIHR